MALLFMDGFEEYSNGTLASGNTNHRPFWSSSWGNNESFSTVAKTAQTGITGKSLANSSNGPVVYLTITPTTGTLIMGFNWRPATFPNRFCGFTADSIAHGHTSNASTGIRVIVSTTGVISVVNNSSGATLGTCSGTYAVGGWYHFAIKYVFSTTTTGSIEIKIDDVTVLNVSGIATSGGASQISNVYLQGTYTSISSYFDDFYLCDDTGTTNNDFLGPVGVYTLYPTGAGSLTQMTPSAGSNFQCVDEMGYTATDWVTPTAAGQTDLYTMSDLPISPTSVAGVMVKARSQKATTNNSALQLAVKSGGTTDFSSNRSVTTLLWQDIQGVFETKPGGGAWDEATVNGMEAGIKGV